MIKVGYPFGGKCSAPLGNLPNNLQARKQPMQIRRFRHTCICLLVANVYVLIECGKVLKCNQQFKVPMHIFD
jgi:hypothetical protein